MYQRKESIRRVVLEDGTAINVRILDGILIEDLMIQHAQARGFQEVTGISKSALIQRDIKDYLIRLYTIS